MSHEPKRAPLSLPPATPLAVPGDFDAALAGIGVTLPQTAIARVADYLGLLRAMNEHVNLTAITEPDAMWTRHALDALTIVPLLEKLPAGGALADVGSGGGVPGIILAIARPDLRVTLIEATEKKAAFLVAVAAALQLENVAVEAARAEDLTRGAHARAFDVVTARAVAKVRALLPWTFPFVKPRGRLIFVKGERAPIELADARRDLARLGCTHERTITTPTGRLVILRAP
jgi:16S rRNA (guanine527-N7)-methyltransferase